MTMTNASGTNRLELPASGTAAGKWRPVAGFTWELFFIALAWTMAFATIPVLAIYLLRGAHPGALFWTCFWVFFGLTYKLTAWLSDKYRQRQWKTLVSAQDLLASDTRPHVVYLRSFKDDETTSRLLNLSTEEQELAVAMLEIGPFIAFGEPGENSPDPGAARMYVDHENWQDLIVDLISNARLVVARIANSQSFWWEISTSLRILKPESLLLLLPADQNEYEEFRRRANEIFPRQLPEHEFQSSQSAFSRSHISLEGLIHFGPDWTPHLQKLKPPALRQNYWVPGVPTFKMALRPVYEQLGVAWKRPPLQPLQILPVILLLLFAVLVLLAGALQVVQFLELIRKHA
jgi:hypothetical protein